MLSPSLTVSAPSDSHGSLSNLSSGPPTNRAPSATKADAGYREGSGSDIDSLPLRNDLNDLHVEDSGVKVLLQRIKAKLTTSDPHYVDACMRQLGLCLRLAKDPYAFGIDGVHKGGNCQGYARYRNAVSDLLSRVIEAESLTCNQICDELFALGEIGKYMLEPAIRVVS